jgi:hypothetical protein
LIKHLQNVDNDCGNRDHEQGGQNAVVAEIDEEEVDERQNGEKHEGPPK